MHNLFLSILEVDYIFPLTFFSFLINRMENDSNRLKKTGFGMEPHWGVGAEIPTMYEHMVETLKIGFLDRGLGGLDLKITLI